MDSLTLLLIPAIILEYEGTKFNSSSAFLAMDAEFLSLVQAGTWHQALDVDDPGRNDVVGHWPRYIFT